MLKSLGAKTILYPTPVSVVGTYDKEGKPNVMTAAWVGICCSRPPCIAVSLRKATYTHGNIVERGAFTINTPSEKYVKETDYFGVNCGRRLRLDYTHSLSAKSLMSRLMKLYSRMNFLIWRN